MKAAISAAFALFGRLVTEQGRREAMALVATMVEKVCVPHGVTVLRLRLWRALLGHSPHDACRPDPHCERPCPRFLRLCLACGLPRKATTSSGRLCWTW